MAAVEDLLTLAIAAHRQGDLDEAAAAYEAVLRAQPNNADAAWLLGRVAATRGNTPLAITLFDWALTWRPDLAGIHDDLATAYYAQGETDKAVASYRAKVKASIAGFPERTKYAADPNHIVFAGVDPRTRHALMAGALKHLGFRVTLLYQKEPNIELGQFFSDWKQFTSAGEGLSMALGYSPLCYHLFMIWGDDFAPALAMAHPGPVVLDFFDTVYAVAGIASALRQLTALSAADGLVCRDLETSATPATRQRARSIPRVWFPEYGVEMPPLRGEPSGPLTVVSVGEVHIPHPQGMDYYTIARLLVQSGIHFHIYPSPLLQGASEEEVRKLHEGFVAIHPERCHIHPYTPFSELRRQLSQFDFGLCLSPTLLFQSNPDQLGHPIWASGSSRLSDFISAGLPVIMNGECTLQRFLCRRYGARPVDARILFGQDLAWQLFNLRAQRVERERSARFLVDRHTPRLANFYKRVAGSAGVT